MHKSTFGANFNFITHTMGYTLGAKVLTNPVKVYYIYYGNVSDSQKQAIETFTNGFDSTPLWGLTKSYYYQESNTTDKIYVDGGLAVGKSVTDNYSVGNIIADTAIPTIVQAQIDSGALPEDTDGIYFVVSSNDVAEFMRFDIQGGQFCQNYCGYHASWPLTSGNRIHYGFAGLIPPACYDACAPQANHKVSPNGDVALDSLFSVIAHELTEAVTDPNADYLRAWQAVDNLMENADLCSYKFGETQKDDTGATYNLEFGGHKYLIQQNWDLVKQTCASS